MANAGATRVFQQGAFVALFALVYFGAGTVGNIFYFEPENVATRRFSTFLQVGARWPDETR
jgi:hypothetical protein